MLFRDPRVLQDLQEHLERMDTRGNWDFLDLLDLMARGGRKARWETQALPEREERKEKWGYPVQLEWTGRKERRETAGWRTIWFK